MSFEEKNHVTQEPDDVSCRIAVSLPVAHKDDDPMGITEETAHVPPRKKQNLLLEIPSRTPEECSQDFVSIKMPMTPSPTPTPKRVNFLVSSHSVDAPINNSPRSATSKGKSSIRNILPKLSFRYRTPADIEKANTPTPEVSSLGPREKPLISRSLSLSKIFTPRIKRTSSLPVEHIGISNTESTHGGNGSVGGPLSKKETRRKIARSLSVPTNNKDKSLRRMNSFFRVVPSTPRVKEINELLSASPTKDTENEDADDGGEDIAEEEAVCRICLVELCEGGETFKLECSCKGELALAHQECAIKWFSIKGNKTCDVCKEDVKNLPVTLLRIQSVRNRISGASRSPLEDVNGVWQEVPVLVIVSMLAYFCFLEQLLVAKMGTGAIAISLPFSCVLGLLSSMTSSTMVKSRFIWIYASFQFAMVVLFAHIFYSLVHVQAVLSVLLATFAGFGVVMSGSSILVEFFRWRRRSQALQEQQHGPQLMTQAGQQPQTVNTPRSDTSNRSHPVVQDLQNSNQS
ncbi:uncharacterized protein [Cicer arietinum]|uniref:E3 ubiquitin-protein ligase MARCH7-like n=1 Tax=Cicer arietinum TaxID=3827 RepID=A0A1S2YKF8_CICAR|nr:E3 ubiquitin-protein ligase MARCH7-like [Cicer arietinum]XP_004505987.1 E3 ubiquitin-protein ligase MARCH7-like [Cicer arietinum]